MKLVLPYPPSANRYWRMFKGRMLVSRAAREYKVHVRYWATLVNPVHGEPLAGLVRVHVEAYRPARRGDLDNTLKVLLDALKGIAFVDDSQVVALIAERFDDSINPRAEVTITEAA